VPILDDIKEIESMFQVLNKESKSVGLKMNIAKTKIMISINTRICHQKWKKLQ